MCYIYIEREREKESVHGFLVSLTKDIEENQKNTPPCIHKSVESVGNGII